MINRDFRTKTQHELQTNAPYFHCGCLMIGVLENYFGVWFVIFVHVFLVNCKFESVLSKYNNTLLRQKPTLVFGIVKGKSEICQFSKTAHFFRLKDL